VSSTTRKCPSANTAIDSGSPEKRRGTPRPKPPVGPASCATKHKGAKAADFSAGPTFGGQANSITIFGLLADRPGTRCPTVRTATSRRPRPAPELPLLAPTQTEPGRLPPLAHGRIARRRWPGCERCHDARAGARSSRMKLRPTRTPAFSVETSTSACPQQLSPKSMFRLANWTKRLHPCHKNVHAVRLVRPEALHTCHSAKVTLGEHRFRSKPQDPPLPGGSRNKKPCATCHAPTAQGLPGRNASRCHKDVTTAASASRRVRQLATSTPAGAPFNSTTTARPASR